MTEDEVKKLATAIAKANGHSEPEAWADKVCGHFTGVLSEVLAAQPASTVDVTPEA